MSRSKTEQRAHQYFQKLKQSRGKAFYRCGSCDRKYVLKRELWEYQIYPKCQMCGEVNWYIDNYTYKLWKEKRGSYAVCKCNFVHYNHKPGSVAECELNFIT